MKQLYPLFLLALVWSVVMAVSQHAQAQSVEALRFQYAAYQAQGEVFPAERLFDFEGQKQNRHGSYLNLRIDPQALEAMFAAKPQAIRLRVPSGPGQEYDLELVRVFPVKEGAVFSTAGIYGETRADYQPGLYYRGSIAGAGKNASALAVSVFQNGLMGMIATESGNWNLGPAANDFSRTDYILSNDLEQKVPPFECHTPDDDVPSLLPGEQMGKSALLPPTVNCLDVFFVSDHDLYLDQSSSVAQTMDYITGIFNLVATIYANEDINIRLSGIMVWENPDPFDETDSQAALNSFEQQILSNFTGDVAILMAIDDENGGRARREFVCDSDDARHGYCDLDVDFDPDINNYSWDVNVTAHELGHLVGSHHTHWCGWVGGAIDDCFCQGIADGNFDPPASGDCREPTNADCVAGPIPAVGTIMSYCHGADGVGISFVTSNGGGFGPQPRAAIINYLEVRPCLDVCDCPGDLAPADLPAVIDGGNPSIVRKFVAGNSITSSSEITPGTRAIFDAGVFIRLIPGFWARAGCDFHAYIDGCQAPVIADFHLEDRQAAPDPAPEFSIIPNPSKGYSTLILVLSQPDQVSITLHGLSGKAVRPLIQSLELPPGTHQLELQEYELPIGIYVISVQCGQTIRQQKWVIVR